MNRVRRTGIVQHIGYLLPLFCLFLTVACATPAAAPTLVISSPTTQTRNTVQANAQTPVVISGTPFVITGTAIAYPATVLPGTSNQATPTPLTGAKVVTLSDNRQTLYLHPGDTFTLRLPSLYDWHLSPTGNQILILDSNQATTQGIEAVYKAIAPGNTIITASGDPGCRKSKPPCMLPSISFSLTVIVQ